MKEISIQLKHKPLISEDCTTTTKNSDLIEVKRRRFLSDYNIFGSRPKLPGHRTSLRVPSGPTSGGGTDPDITLDSDLILKLKSLDSSGLQSPDCSGLYSKNSEFSEYDITDDDVKRLKMLFRKGKKESSSNPNNKSKSKFFEMCQSGAHSFMNSFIKCICDA